MRLDQLLLFITVTLFVSASPGPVMLSCLANGGQYGVRKSLYGMAGASVGNLVLMLLSVLGLGLVLSRADWLFDLIKWIGAAYLAFLGWQLFVKPVSVSTDPNTRFTTSAWVLFVQSVGIATSNPKGVIYFGALFPQFIAPDRPLVPQFALLTVIFLLMDLVWMLAYAVGGREILRWLKTPRHHRWFNRLSGSALIVAGVFLLLVDNQH